MAIGAYIGAHYGAAIGGILAGANAMYGYANGTLTASQATEMFTYGIVGGFAAGAYIGGMVGMGAFLWLANQALGVIAFRHASLSKPAIPIPMAKIQKDLVYARLASASYDEAEGNGELVNLFALGWDAIDIYPDNPTSFNGYRARLFMQESTHEFVLSFAGTNDFIDIGDDAYQAVLGSVFGMDKQYDSALSDSWKAFSKANETFPNPMGNSVRFVGHSLGGGLASAASYVYGMPATTFNAAGINKDDYPPKTANPDLLIDAYRVQGDFLSITQDMSLVSSGFYHLPLSILGMIVPNGVGTNYWLKGTSSNPGVLHTMAQVKAGMLNAAQ